MITISGPFIILSAELPAIRKALQSDGLDAQLEAHVDIDESWYDITPSNQLTFESDGTYTTASGGVIHSLGTVITLDVDLAEAELARIEAKDTARLEAGEDEGYYTS